MTENKLLDDIVVLGRAAPDEINDGRKTVCVGGWSNSEGYVRIYPTNVISSLKRWNKVSIPVERNKKDTRNESWKIQGSKSQWSNLHKKIKVSNKLSKKDQIKLINNLPKVSCIQDLNNNKLSLGVIEPIEILDKYFEEKESYSETSQTKLDDFFGRKHKNIFQVKTKQNYPVIPKIKWKCPGPCKLKQNYHDTQILEWGFYEWMRKNDRSNWSKVWDNSKITSEDYQFYFFIGNLNRHRSSFMIISILRYKIDKDQDSLNDFF